MMDDIRGPLPRKPTKLMDQLRALMRSRQMAYKTEKTYCYWIVDFIYYHKKQHPKFMGAREVDAYLSHLAIDRNCSVNTQKTALNSLVFLYTKFMSVDLNSKMRHPPKIQKTGKSHCWISPATNTPNI